MPKFEILCTTMHQKDFSKLKEMNVHSDIIYANQCDYTTYEEYEFEGHTAKMISTQTRGVGKNRNLALIYASADICLFADDDVVYVDDMEEQVLSEFDKYPDADVIVFHFQCDDPDRRQQQYTRTKKWPRLARTPWGTFCLAFRLKSVHKENVWFTTLYGGGCVFPAGEDSMWIKDMRHAGMIFYVSNKTIGKVSHETSTWFTGFDEKYFYGVGAFYAALRIKASFIRHLYTVIRTKGKGSLSLSEKMRWLRHGKEGYKRVLSYQDYIKTNPQ